MKKETVLVVSAVILAVFPPERYAFYPRCPVHEAFGLLCPGCGATHAAAALLHGHVAEAVRWNPLFVLAVFAAAFYEVLLGIGGRTWSRPPGWAVALGVTIALVFGVARNFVL